MRDIKFRGMSVNGHWYCGLLSISRGMGSQPEAGYYISNEVGMPWAYQVRPETVGQSTGLTDKNGKGIYEGDNLSWKDPETTYKEISTVKWGRSAFEVELKGNYGDEHICDYPADECEVIGNIYELEAIDDIEEGKENE